MLNWQEIDTVLLDMDGTLLDLHYDNQLWNHIVPQAYADHQQISLPQAKQIMAQKYQDVADSMHWYCYDFWTQTLELDIYQLQHQVADKINWRQDAQLFLKQLIKANKARHILTNAHPEGVRLKNEYTGLVAFFDSCISTHEYGQPKEEQQLWHKVQQRIGFDPARTLFIDDNELILDAAKTFGIKHLIAIDLPDSQLGKKTFHRHQAISHFSEIMPQ
ncbi:MULTISPECIES: GMP/IMP nucleotidase [unclassified Motilimonas]|uniref:GMP/IMP nucleotidase n=1 Tax=Motilimonas TaxID=1914248 RepID=UPI001E2BD00F|nr:MULTISPECIES: GMP/IMP nucleotidase [unclassified Motilimonas]MCE0557378.1 GMP/IMP nucleotidase [Motilimonas sp. E26]MDO6527367.1 GMP/IMP nucleotidase [Motilimonas sp. 1_MG-2023]